MIPAWVWTILVVIAGCVGALWLGSSLPEMAMDPVTEFLLVLFAAVCVVFAVINDFPFLLAFSCWIPFFPHLGFASLQTVCYFMVWMAGVLFVRLCLHGYLKYRQSFNWALLIIFAWVPIRFMMNPVMKLGATAGGSGVSGALPYFNYVLAAALMIFVGAVLTDRSKIMYFMRWCNFIVLISGVLLTICAFIPASGPYLAAMGSFAAGNISDGILRLVQLPGYGLFLLEASLCPVLFRLKLWQSGILFALGSGMMIIGGNRSALAAAIIAIPVMLFLRRQSHAMAISLCFMIAGVGLLRMTVASMPQGQIPPLLRSFGMFDSQIDKATGGDASAEWRYGIWKDAIRVIMQNPLTGKGFGNLPQHVESSDIEKSHDFELVMAGGESHNGFINAAYGFGIPFMVALSVAMILFFFKESALALSTDKHDPEMRDMHAFLAGMFATYPVLIYTAFDLSVNLLWIYIGISCILSHLPRGEIQRSTETGAPLRKYGEEPRPAGQYSYRAR